MTIFYVACVASTFFMLGVIGTLLVLAKVIGVRELL
jgi:hypothetical protein